MQANRLEQEEKRLAAVEARRKEYQAKVGVPNALNGEIPPLPLIFFTNAPLCKATRERPLEAEREGRARELVQLTQAKMEGAEELRRAEEQAQRAAVAERNAKADSVLQTAQLIEDHERAKVFVLLIKFQRY